MLTTKNKNVKIETVASKDIKPKEVRISPEDFCNKYKDVLLPVLKRLADR